MCMCGFSPGLKSLTPAITSYQGLDEAEGTEEKDRWRKWEAADSRKDLRNRTNQQRLRSSVQ